MYCARADTHVCASGRVYALITSLIHARASKYKENSSEDIKKDNHVK